MNLRTLVCVFSLCASVLLVPERACAEMHELYATVGGGYFGGTSRVLVGAGGGIGYRLHTPWNVSFYTETQWLWYGGNAFTTSVGSIYTFHVRRWAPALGLQFTLGYGQQLRVIDASMPDPASTLLGSVQVRAAPLRFQLDGFTVAALVFNGGAGLEAGRPSLAISFAVLEMGMLF